MDCLAYLLCHLAIKRKIYSNSFCLFSKRYNYIYQPETIT